MRQLVLDILSQPAVLVAAIALIGLLIQKKSSAEIIKGTTKTFLGFIVLSAGASVLVGSLDPFGKMFQEAFHVNGVVPNNEAIVAMALTKYGSTTALIMFFGMIANILVARFTNLKYIFLTGHHTLYMACMIAVILVVAGMEGFQLVLIGSLALGLIMAVFPALAQPFMRKITGNDNIALGHTSASVSLLAAILGKYLGNKENDSEKIKLPKGLEFLRDSNVITALTMGALFVIGAAIVLFKDTPGARELVASAGNQNFIVYAIVQSFTFAGGIAVVLMGVRMFIGEIVPAFNGIATKLVPGAKPALDCPIVYPYAPNAVILGFVGAFAGALLWLVVLGNTVAYVFVPTMIVLFFHGATAGVFGNATGGVRGALIGGFITSTVVAWGQFIMVRYLITSTIPDTAMWAADSDMFIIGPFIKLLANLLF